MCHYQIIDVSLVSKYAPQAQIPFDSIIEPAVPSQDRYTGSDLVIDAFIDNRYQLQIHNITPRFIVNAQN